MNIKDQSFPVKLYNFGVFLSHKLKGNDPDSRYNFTNYIGPDDRTDICTFMRRILLWLPLSLFIYGGFLYLFYQLTIGIILNTFGIAGLIYGTGSILFGFVAVSVILILLAGGSVLFDKISRYLKNKANSKETSDTVNLTKTWYQSFKDKTCVLINVKRNDENV